MPCTFHAECMGVSLKWLATISTGVYAGGNLYVSIIETPSHNKHSPKLSAQMHQINRTAWNHLWTPVALCGAASAVGGFLLTRRRCLAARWLLADSLLLFIIPVNRYLIGPTSDAIMDFKDTIDEASEMGESWLVSKLDLWNKYHNIRTALSVLAFGYMTFLLAHKK